MTDRIGIHRGDLPEDRFDRCVAAGQIAWDIETSGLDWATDRIGTCQIAYPEGVELVQIEADREPRRLKDLLAHPEVQKVFHHGAFDLRFMVHQWDASVRNVACTKIASKILWPDAPVGRHRLQELVRTQFGRQLSKEQQQSDWLADDLTPEQTNYAAGDVIFLTRLLSRLTEIAEARGAAELLRASFAYLPTRVSLDILGAGDVFTY